MGATMTTTLERIWLGIAGLSGAAAVGADAAARHVLAADPYRMDLAMTGARYGLIHGVALLAVALLARAPGGRGAGFWLAVAGWCFTAGLLLFPGSLYALAGAAPAAVARLAPIGGIAFIAGWAALLLAALAPRRVD